MARRRIKHPTRKHDFVRIPGQGIENTREHKPWDIAAYVYQDFWQAKGNPERKMTFFTGGDLGIGQSAVRTMAHLR